VNGLILLGIIQH